MATHEIDLRKTSTIEAEIFASGNTQKNLSSMEAFIRNSALTKSQIVSITSHESHIAIEDSVDPDNELLLFYRQVPNT